METLVLSYDHTHTACTLYSIEKTLIWAISFLSLWHSSGNVSRSMSCHHPRDSRDAEDQLCHVSPRGDSHIKETAAMFSPEE